MKAVMLSIRPRQCELIAKGKETIVVCKFKPKIETPFKVYIYCTKEIRNGLFITKEVICDSFSLPRIANGFVIGEFICDYILKDLIGEYEDVFEHDGCMTLDEQKVYGQDKPLYGWHISDLKIYGKPKELNEFIKPCLYGGSPCKVCEYYSDYSGKCRNIITRSPQSYVYVEEVK